MAVIAYLVWVTSKVQDCDNFDRIPALWHTMAWVAWATKKKKRSLVDQLPLINFNHTVLSPHI